jgi:hypothetical protein
LTAALLLIPLPLVSAVVGPLSGLLADHIGARIPATVGVLVQAAALVWFITWLSPTTSYWQIAVGLALMGLGGGLFWSPNTSAAMNSAPLPRRGIASATLESVHRHQHHARLAKYAGLHPRHQERLPGFNFPLPGRSRLFVCAWPGKPPAAGASIHRLK